MLLEDDNPWGTIQTSSAVHKNLDSLSMDDLWEYIGALKGEIKRAEAEIAKKSSSRTEAEALFGE